MPASWSKYALSVNLRLAECTDLELFSSERYYFGYVLDTNPYLKFFAYLGCYTCPLPAYELMNPSSC